MKCKKCGYITRTLAAMARHYRKAHPGAMKRHRFRRHPSQFPGQRKISRTSYCPHCGAEL